MFSMKNMSVIRSYQEKRTTAIRTAVTLISNDRSVPGTGLSSSDLVELTHSSYRKSIVLYFCFRKDICPVQPRIYGV